MSIEEGREHARIAVSIRSARAAVGWNQQEFADLMGVSRSTVARIEILQMLPRADFLLRALALFKAAGVEVDLLTPGKVQISVGESAIDAVLNDLSSTNT